MFDHFCDLDKVFPVFIYFCGLVLFLFDPSWSLNGVLILKFCETAYFQQGIPVTPGKQDTSQ